MTSIGAEAFSSCNRLTSITIGNSVTSIGTDAFKNTNPKKVIWLTNTQPSGASLIKGAINYVANGQSYSNIIVYPFLSSMFEVDGIRYVPVSPSERTCDAIDCVYDNTATNTKIPSTVTYKGITMAVREVQPYVCYNNPFIENLECDFDGDIPEYAFYGCSNITSLSFGEKVTSIGDYSFQGCSSLQSVTIPNSVTEMGAYSFQNCSSLADITIGNQVSTINIGAFRSCSSLSFINIPSKVKTIKDYAFYECTKLKTVVIADREDELTLGCNNSSPLFASCPLDSVYIGGNISYNYSPFYRNTKLRTVVITDKETEISSNEFYGCTNLQSFTVGDGVTTFGDWAFSGCTSLTSLSFGSQLQNIGREAFSDCAAVTKIVSKAITPPTCDTQALDDINKWTCTLYVPSGSLTDYQAADQWKEFFFVEEGDGNGVDSVSPEAKQCAKPTIYYSEGKLSYKSETEGVVFFSNISDTDMGSYSDEEVQLSVTYHISVYAAKNGCQDSEVAEATLCWIEVDPQKEGISEDTPTDAKQLQAMPVLIQAEGGEISIDGAPEGTKVALYDAGGVEVGTAISRGGKTLVPAHLPQGSIAIVKIGEKAVKVAVK